jgi:hypothetical protein
MLVLRLVRINEDYAVLTANNGFGMSFFARGVLAVHTGGGSVRDVNTGVSAAFGALNVHPAMTVAGLRICIGRPRVAHIFILTGYKAVIAVKALFYIYY